MHRKIYKNFLLNHPLLATCARNYKAFAVIMMVVWLILNIQFCTAVGILKGVKKLVNFKIFVLITCTILKICRVPGYRFRYAEIDRNNCELFLSEIIYTQYLSPSLIIQFGTFPHNMLDRVQVWISDKNQYIIDDASYIN